MRSKNNIFRLLFVCALEAELKGAKHFFGGKKYNNFQIDFLTTGMGNISMTLELTKKLATKNYDFVVNYGVCGYKTEAKELIQIVRSVFAPTQKEILTPVFFEHAPLCSIYCSETPIYDDTLLGDENYVDMESWAFEKVCEAFKIPRIILKVPVDKVGPESRNFDIPKAIRLLEKNIDFERLMKEIEQHLKKLPCKRDISLVERYYHLTVSEKVLLEKYIAKYETLSEKDFSEFFKKSRNGDKKEFFKILEKENEKYSKLYI